MSRRSSSGSATYGIAGRKDGFLEKLDQLRSFVGPCVEEVDLHNCLKQCGCDVNLAATKLVTGDYSRRTAVTKRASTTFFDLTSTDTSPRQKAQQKKPRITQEPRSTPKMASNSGLKPTPQANSNYHRAIPVSPDTCRERYLLCQRWLTAESRTKGGKVMYQEQLQVTCSANGPPMVRLSGDHIHGLLPRNLCIMLAPLILSNYLQLTAESLIEDKSLFLGAQLPINLRVSIENPAAFFSLFHEINTGSARNTYFGDLKAKKKNRKVHELDLGQCAFNLLQWAQYGDVPDFTPPVNDNNHTDDDAKQSSARESDSDLDEAVDDVVLDESEFQVEGKQDAWAAGVVEAASKDPLADIPEIPDPEGLLVTLQPYQRQALYWMWKRETDPSNRSIVNAELQLLTELARNKAPNPNIHGVDFYRREHQTEDIMCDCGPVLVSAQAATQSTTIDGDVNPVTHPLWQRRFLASSDFKSTISFYVNELLGVASAKSPNPPKQCVGGIQADAMGLGKTVMILALILMSKRVEGGGTTLVVAPLSLIGQWEEELTSKTNLTCKVYYGDSAKSSVDDGSFVGIDVVITTYGTLQGEMYAIAKNKANNDGLLVYDWFRVILDEAHCIKNPSTLSSRACCMLRAERRWCVTGTPIQNSLQDAYGLLKFLRHEPWCESGFWKTAISNVSIAKKEDGGNHGDGLQQALERVRRVLTPLILRRSKDTLNKKGEPILTLPPMEVQIVEVHFSAAEREFYNALKSKSQSIFEGIVEQGSFTKAYFQIFALINRLRQACDHVALTVKSHVEDWSPTEIDTNEAGVASSKLAKSSIQGDAINNKFIESLLAKFQSNQSTSGTEKWNLNNEFCTQVVNKLSQAISSCKDEVDDECAICLENPKIVDAVITPCAHVFCRDCLVKIMRAAKPLSRTLPNGECPCCNAKIDAKRIISLHQQGDKTETHFLVDENTNVKVDTSTDQSESEQAARETLENALKGAGSAKLNAILDELDKVWQSDPGSKVLIFSQFLGFLDLLQVALKKRRIPYGRLDGKLSLAERKRVVETFKTDCHSKIEGSVLLLSMKAGGVGLNLVQASSVFIIDPWWNAAIEDQCIMRCHRIGQTAKMVRVRKFVVQDSVEEHIVSLQERKKSMAGKILSDNASDTLDDANKVTLEDFKLLFGDF